jgi:hypothetical protein
MNLRPWIARGLTVLVGSATLAVVAAVLAGLLQAGGDANAAVAVRGVLWVAMSVTGLTLIVQMVLLSLDTLQKPPPPRPEHRPPRDPEG